MTIDINKINQRHVDFLEETRRLNRECTKTFVYAGSFLVGAIAASILTTRHMIKNP